MFCGQGLSTELGAFVAGVMLSATDQQEHCLALLEHLKQFFLSLFVSSIGLVISPTFLAQHLRVLAGGLVLTIACKTILARPDARASSEYKNQVQTTKLWQMLCSTSCPLSHTWWPVHDRVQGSKLSASLLVSLQRVGRRSARWCGCSATRYGRRWRWGSAWRRSASLRLCCCRWPATRGCWRTRCTCCSWVRAGPCCAPRPHFACSTKLLLCWPATRAAGRTGNMLLVGAHLDSVQALSTNTAPCHSFRECVLFLARMASGLHTHHVWEASSMTGFAVIFVDMCSMAGKALAECQEG